MPEDTIELWLPCNPPRTTHQAGSRVMYREVPLGTKGAVLTQAGKWVKPFVGRCKKSKATKVRQGLLDLVRPHAPDQPLEGPLSLGVVWVYPWLSSHTKKQQRKGALFNDKRPDSSNLVKFFEDVMTEAGYWRDDAQIACSTFIKMHGGTPGISVSVAAMPHLYALELLLAHGNGPHAPCEP